MAGGDDATLIKVAVFGICMSIFCSVGITLLIHTDGDYDYDAITAYRSELIGFSGESMINQNPWVLTGCYTPWNDTLPLDDTHIDPDGWLYGESVAYGEIGKAANIRLSPEQKSSVPLYVSDDRPTYTRADGVEWWRGLYAWNPVFNWLIEDVAGVDSTRYVSQSASIYNYTGYRYTFDPVLPFAEGEGQQISTKDGTLSIVWYNYNGQEGISGGLQIYGGDVLLSSISATDIIVGYQSASGLASTYDFVFDGVHLTLSVLFDQHVINSGVSLMQAFASGSWSMAISSVSAGNFFDIDGSNSFAATAGSVFETMAQIFTFSVPSIENPWMDLILWLMVGLPMSVALLCVTLRAVSSFKPL